MTDDTVDTTVKSQERRIRDSPENRDHRVSDTPGYQKMGELVREIDPHPDEQEEIGAFQAAVVLLAACEVGAHAGRVARYTGLDPAWLAVVGKRLRKSEVLIGDKTRCAWVDKEDDDIFYPLAFGADVLVALGFVFKEWPKHQIAIRRRGSTWVVRCFDCEFSFTGDRVTAVAERDYHQLLVRNDDFDCREDLRVFDLNGGFVISCRECEWSSKRCDTVEEAQAAGRTHRRIPDERPEPGTPCAACGLLDGLSPIALKAIDILDSMDCFEPREGPYPPRLRRTSEGAWVCRSEVECDEQRQEVLH
jgi:hypothetical protein